MITGQNLIFELNSKLKAMDIAQKECVDYGKEKAQTEHDYRIALAEKILSLRADGLPATITQDIAKGDRAIANLRLKRDIAEAMYEASVSALQNYKLQTRVLDAQVSREWGRDI